MEIINEILAHPEKAKKIANNSARTLRAQYLTSAVEAFHWRRLIKGYGLVIFEPQILHEDGTWRCVPFESLASIRKLK